MSLRPGTLLDNGKYRIVRFIGAGGFGCTYEAEFSTMGIRVAIKEFYISDFCDRDATGSVTIVSKTRAGFIEKLREKFVREALNIARLRHPNIVRVSDRFDENGTSYYVMDYIAGRSLQSLIESEGPLPEARALRYIGQVMDALECIHGENMLHLDVKPDNIMIDAKDNAILIDFGVSKQYDEIDGHNTSTIMGQTPGYAPPEQSGNSIRQFTPAADIYALGATLYTALTGKVPPSSNDIISGAARLAPPPATTSPSTMRAINLMLQPSMTQRPQSIAVARALFSGTENGKVSGVIENGKWIIENSIATPTETKTATPTNGTATSIGGIQPVATGPSTQTPGKSTELAGAQPKLKKWLWATVTIAVVAIGAVIYFLNKGTSEKQKIATITNTTEMVSNIPSVSEEQVILTDTDIEDGSSDPQQSNQEQTSDQQINQLRAELATTKQAYQQAEDKYKLQINQLRTELASTQKAYQEAEDKYTKQINQLFEELANAHQALSEFKNQKMIDGFPCPPCPEIIVE